MIRQRCRLLVAVSLLMTTTVAGQTPVTQTTKSPVYSAAQATRGESLYLTHCVSCHTVATYKGGPFRGWQGKTLADLFVFLRNNMPESDPGLLTAQEYTDVVAFLLKLNGLPSGTTDLSADEKVLRDITIELMTRPFAKELL